MIKDIIKALEQGKALYIRHNITLLKALILNQDSNSIKIKISNDIDSLTFTDNHIKDMEINDKDIILSLDVESILKNK